MIQMMEANFSTGVRTATVRVCLDIWYSKPLPYVVDGHTYVRLLCDRTFFHCTCVGFRGKVLKQ